MKAFPIQEVWDNEEYYGMDLRDYFAAKAMQGLLSTTKNEQWFCEDVSELCYEMADAMMKARLSNGK